MHVMLSITLVCLCCALYGAVPGVAAPRKEVDVDLSSSSLPYDYKRPVTAIEQHYGSLHRMLFDLPITGLNETCQVQLCEMMESALSCKGVGFDLSKTCARYILGYLYTCPGFPAPAEIFNAPYICLSQIKQIIPPSLITGLTSGGGVSLASLRDTLTNVHNYMNSNFSENCERRCFQNYIEQANTFFGNCHDELSTWTTQAYNNNTRYPEVWILYGFQEFRNQVCATDPDGVNCFGKVQKFLPTYYNGSKAIVPTVNIFNHDCNYYDNTTQNQVALEQVCAEFQDIGCCFGNNVAMMAQSQTNESSIFNHNAIKEFPPCLLRYLKHTCGNASSGNALDPVEFCSSGANGNMSVITGSVTMGQLTEIHVRDKGIVNVYDRESLTTFQGSMGLGLLVKSIAADNKLTTAKALWVEVVDYAYYSDIVRKQSDSTLLTPTDGTYPVDQSDYNNAKSMRIDFQIVLQGYTQEEAKWALNNFTTTYTCGTLLLELEYDNGACVNVTDTPHFHRAEPFSLPPKSAAARGVTTGALQATLACTAGALAMLLL